MKKLIFTLFALTVFASNAFSQTWEKMVNSNGFDSQILCLLSHNNRLYAGGTFTTVDGNTVNGVAVWDGSNWLPMGSGFDGASAYVYDLAVYNNDIYAAGSFTKSGAFDVSGVAKWDGKVWQPVGGGIAITDSTNYVKALHVFNNELYAGGNFDSAGTASAANIAKWNGTGWQQISNGTDDAVLGFHTHNNELYVGGFFVFDQSSGTGLQYRIAKLDNGKLVNVGTYGMGDATAHWHVEAMATYNGDLYAGGRFNVLENGSVIANNIASWNGTQWSIVKGPGVGVASTQAYPVRTMVEYQGKLYVGGNFFAAGQVAAPNLATWDGTDWKNADLGTDGTVNDMVVHNGSLIVAGAFQKAGGKDHRYISKFTPATNVGEINTIAQFIVYPNPVTDGTISVQTGADKTTYELYNMNGQQVQQGAVPENGKVQLNNELPAGNYLIQMQTNAGNRGIKHLSIIK